MKLKTSFFNGSVLKKNLTRFAPLWILYAVAEILGLLTIYQAEAVRIADDINHIMGPVSMFHMVYALLVAACLFGDLFDSRMCHGLHAMPMRREGWLITNLVSGLVFALIPALAGGIVGAVMLRELYWVALVWQGVSLLQFAFFFGLAVFSAMCAGKRLGMIAIYGIFNFLSLLVQMVATTLYEPWLPGVVLDFKLFERFCPVAAFVGDMYLDIEVRYNSDAQLLFHGLTQGSWGYLWICAGMGAGFLLLAWLLYRKRHLETAGDFVSFRPMGYFFLLAYTIAVGLFLYGFTSLLGIRTDYIFLAVGLVIGYFTGWMLLERTTKIFTVKVAAGFVAFALLFAGSIGLTILDPLGLVTRVPDAQETDTLCMYLSSNNYYYNNDTTGWYIDDPVEADKIRQLHRQMIETPVEMESEPISIQVRYQLKNGFQVWRSYRIPAISETARNLEPYFSDVRSVFSTDDWESIRRNVSQVQLYPRGENATEKILVDQQQIQRLLAALEADCAAGNMAQHDYFHTGETVCFTMDVLWTTWWEEDSPTNICSEYITVYEDCTHLKAFLEELEIAEA